MQPNSHVGRESIHSNANTAFIFQRVGWLSLNAPFTVSEIMLSITVSFLTSARSLAVNILPTVNLGGPSDSLFRLQTLICFNLTSGAWKMGIASAIQAVRRSE